MIALNPFSDVHFSETISSNYSCGITSTAYWLGSTGNMKSIGCI